MGTLSHRSALSASQIPNGLTVLRIALLPLLIWLFYGQRYLMALACFMLIGVTDLLDGYLARRYGWISWLGSVLDPVADKLVMVTGYFLLWQHGLIPLWLWLVVLGRDLLIISGGLLCRLLLGPYTMAPTRLSKFNTLFQLLLVAAFLLHLSLLPLPALVQWLLIQLILWLTVLSGVQYVLIWGQKVLSSRS